MESPLAMISSSTLLAALAGVAFYIALTHLLLYLRRRQPAYNLSFALLCFAIGVYDLLCAGLYSATTVEQGAHWQRLQSAVLTLGAITLTRFVADYTGRGSRRIQRLLELSFALLLLAIVLDPSDWLWSHQPLIKRVQPPWGKLITYYETTPGPLVYLSNALGFLVFAYAFFMVLRQYREGERRRARPLLVALIIFCVGVANDTAVSSGAYSFVYLIEYCFLALVFVMGQTLLRGIQRAAEMETALRESESRYRNFVEGTSDFIAQIDRHGRLTFVNASLAARLGREPRDCLGRDALEFFPEQEREVVSATFDRWLQEKTAHAAIEKPFASPRGESLEVSWTVTANVDESGEIVSVNCVGRDITSRKRAEEIHLARLDRLQAQQAIIVALATSEAVTGGEIAAVARTVTEAGVDAMDLERVGVWQLSEDSRTLRSIDLYERSQARHVDPITLDVQDCLRFLESLRTDRAIPAAEAASDPRTLELAAVYLQENGVVSCLEVPIRVRGRLFGALSYEHKRGPRAWKDDEISFACDVAEQLSQTVQNAERSQAERERQILAEAIEQAAEIVVITDPDGAIQYVNPAFERVTEYSREAVLGRNPRLLKSGLQSQEFYRELWQTICDGRTWRGRFTNRKNSGSLYLEEAVISPVRDRTGRISRFVSVKRDITDRVRLEDQLRHALKMEAIGQLAGGVAHDFNNLLTPILGYMELLLMTLPADDPSRSLLLEVRGAAESARDLTQQLLAFSRKQLIELKVLDPGAVVSRFAKILRRTIRENIEIVLRLSPERSRVRADPSQLEQILMNLAVNAQDAMPEGGIMTIEVDNSQLDESYVRLHPGTPPGPYVLLAVSDNGIGMDPQTIEHIFEPFFTTKTKGRGTGLGLATVYGVVKQHGGEIHVYSEPGRGTTFKIYLPCVAPQDEPEAVVQDSLPVGGVETILVVEDNRMVRRLTASVLREHGYTVLEAGDHQESFTTLASHEGVVDLLLADVILPGMNGKDLYLKLLEMRPSLKVLYMSGYTDDVINHHGVLERGVHFIQKPYTVSGLTRKVREALADVPQDKRSSDV